MHLKYTPADELMTMTWENGDHFKLHLEAQVSHVVGSSAQKGNWKKFWLDHTGRVWPKKCQILGCGQRALVGAHVQGVSKRIRHFFSHPTSNHNHLETVRPIYLKIIVQRVPMVDYSHRKFQVTLINSSRVIAVGSRLRKKVSYFF